MAMRRIASALPLLLLVAAAPPAGPWAVFGLELGKPLVIPMCKHKIRPGGLVSEFTYEDDPAQTCYEPDIALKDAPWRRGSVDFPMKQVPRIVYGNSGFTFMIDGKLEGVQFDTLSYAVTDSVISELSEKFGRPTSVTRFTANPSGIPVPATQAEWLLPNLYVSYRNIDRSIESGTLLVETPIMHGVRRAHIQTQDTQRTKL